MVSKRNIGERQIVIPADLLDALVVDESAQLAFEKLPYSHKKEYVEWIESAKKSETRQRRIRSAVGMITEKQQAKK